MTTQSGRPDQAGSRDVWRTFAYLLAIPLFLGLVLFLPAGTWSWGKGWLFLAVFLLEGTAAAVYGWRANPELYAARSRIHAGTKGWDRILLAVLVPVMLSIFPVSALDAGRFHWSHVPWWACGIGYVLLTAAMVVGTWAQAVNRFFEPTVRIQTDRGHHVIDTGHYAIVRHPGYVAACLFFAGIPLSLGSFWALIPAVISWLLLVVRTVLEDRTLQEELPGYKEYAQRVRYRLVPGVW
jgi:protein-S-isoprenylcysteine O-methyltransferase Ste14